MKKDLITKAFFMIAIMIVAQISFSVMLAEPVQAAATPGCCEKLTTGAYCQPVDDINTQCAAGSEKAGTGCKSIDSCDLGCCYNALNGECSDNTPKQQCKDAGGTWDERSCTVIDLCKPGCCISGDQADIAETQLKCLFSSQASGKFVSFDPNILSSGECLSIARAEDKGCCKTSAGAGFPSCAFGKRNDCTGEFFKDKLCSSPDVGCAQCTPFKKSDCREGYDGVYWFDACGNPENIYNGDSEPGKKLSWNNGDVLPQDQSAGFSGNCDIFSGTRCIKQGNFVGCVSLDCDAETNPTYVSPNSGGGGGTRIHGESWCIYDAPRLTDERSDPVGSETWVHKCIAGKEIVEPCGSTRGDICIEDSIPYGTNSKMSVATCIPNQYSLCYNQTKQEDCTQITPEGINLSLFCYWDSSVNSLLSREGDIQGCLPKYTPATDPKNEKDCMIASSVCTIHWKKGASEGFWKVANEPYSCMEGGSRPGDVNGKLNWFEDANKLCYSKGDCGMFVNIIGDIGNSPKQSFKLTGSGPDSLKTSYVNDWLVRFPAGSWPVYDPKAIFLKQIGTTTYNYTKTLTDKYKDLTPNLSPTLPAYWQISPFNEKSTTTAAVTGAATITGKETKDVTGVAIPLIGGRAKTMTGVQWQNWFYGKEVDTSKWGFGKPSFGSVLKSAGAVLILTGIVYVTLTALGMSSENAAKVSTAFATGATIGTAVAAAAPASWSLGSVGAWGLFIPGLGIILGLVAAVISWLGTEEEKFSTVIFECKPWQPPVGGKNCELCNKDPMKPCDAYRCKSLGAACTLINTPPEGRGSTGKEKCVWKDPNDIKPPVINSATADVGYSTSGVQQFPPDKGFTVVKGTGCLDAYKNFAISIGLTKPAQCKISDKFDYKFDSGEDFGDSIFDYNHTKTYYFDNINVTNLKAGQPYTYYIKCKSVNGVVNDVAYAMKFCIDAGPDYTPPEIFGTTPLTDAYVTYGLNSTNVAVFVEEQSQCRWDVADMKYEDMKYNFSASGTLGGVATSFQAKKAFKLTADMKFFTSGKNTYYIRCKDHPEKPENFRNTDKQSFVLNLQKSQSKLKITSVSPTGTVYGKDEFVPAEVKVTTSEGADNGNADCYYKVLTRDSSFKLFEDTGTNSHIQKLYLPAQTWKVDIKCVDAGANSDNKTASFSTGFDKTAPKLTRVYNEAGLLKVTTDEASTCSYSTKSCSFSFDDGTQMTGTEKEHVTDWIADATFYIQCKDVFGNTKCTATVKMYEK